jgi:uncharacterized membrane protein YdjX (TVP38/TMEM64 family)
LNTDFDKPTGSGNAAVTSAGVVNHMSMKRLLPILVLIAGLLSFFALGLDRYLTFDALRENRETLLALVDRYGILAAIVFVAVYAAAVAFSVPGGAVMTITGGFLFGTWWTTLYVVVAATLGATALFLAVRMALGDLLRARAGPWLKKMEDGFNRNAFSYLLVLRLIPVFPFFVVNLVPAFLGVPLRTYVVATFLGIIPGSFVYASVGNGLGTILDAGETPDLGIIFEPQILIPIIGLAVLLLLPIVYRMYKKPKADKV